MQIILNGLINGLVIAMLGVAFQLVYLPTRIFFIGLAALYSLAPYVYVASLDILRQRTLAITVSLLAVGLLVSFQQDRGTAKQRLSAACPR